MPWRWAILVAAVAAVVPGAIDAWPGTAEEVAPFSAQELGSVRRRAENATVLVSAIGCGHLSLGSAFGVEGVLVSNAHLVRGASEAKVQQGRSLFRVSVLGGHPVLDLAVLAGVGGPDLELAPGNPPVGEPVLLAGRPGGGPVRVEASSVHLYSDGAVWGMGGPVMLLDTPTGPGWSGGPVLDRRGRVVGVLAASDSATGLAIAVPADQLQAWLGTPAAGAGGASCSASSREDAGSR